MLFTENVFETIKSELIFLFILRSIEKKGKFITANEVNLCLDQIKDNDQNKFIQYFCSLPDEISKSVKNINRLIGIGNSVKKLKNSKNLEEFILKFNLFKLNDNIVDEIFNCILKEDYLYLTDYQQFLCLKQVNQHQTITTLTVPIPKKQDIVNLFKNHILKNKLNEFEVPENNNIKIVKELMVLCRIADVADTILQDPIVALNTIERLECALYRELLITTLPSILELLANHCIQAGDKKAINKQRKKVLFQLPDNKKCQFNDYFMDWAVSQFQLGDPIYKICYEYSPTKRQEFCNQLSAKIHSLYFLNNNGFEDLLDSLSINLDWEEWSYIEYLGFVDNFPEMGIIINQLKKIDFIKNLKSWIEADPNSDEIKLRFTSALGLLVSANASTKESFIESYINDTEFLKKYFCIDEEFNQGKLAILLAVASPSKNWHKLMTQIFEGGINNFYANNMTLINDFTQLDCLVYGLTFARWHKNYLSFFIDFIDIYSNYGSFEALILNKPGLVELFFKKITQHNLKWNQGVYRLRALARIAQLYLLPVQEDDSDDLTSLLTKRQDNFYFELDKLLIACSVKNYSYISKINSSLLCETLDFLVSNPNFNAEVIYKKIAYFIYYEQINDWLNASEIGLNNVINYLSQPKESINDFWFLFMLKKSIISKIFNQNLMVKANFSRALTLTALSSNATNENQSLQFFQNIKKRLAHLPADDGEEFINQFQAAWLLKKFLFSNGQIDIEALRFYESIEPGTMTLIADYCMDDFSRSLTSSCKEEEGQLNVAKILNIKKMLGLPEHFMEDWFSTPHMVNELKAYYDSYLNNKNITSVYFKYWQEIREILPYFSQENKADLWDTGFYIDLEKRLDPKTSKFPLSNYYFYCLKVRPEEFRKDFIKDNPDVFHELITNFVRDKLTLIQVFQLFNLDFYESLINEVLKNERCIELLSQNLNLLLFICQKLNVNGQKPLAAKLATICHVSEELFSTTDTQSSHEILVEESTKESLCKLIDHYGLPSEEEARRLYNNFINKLRKSNKYLETFSVLDYFLVKNTHHITLDIADKTLEVSYLRIMGLVYKVIVDPNLYSDKDIEKAITNNVMCLANEIKLQGYREQEFVCQSGFIKILVTFLDKITPLVNIARDDNIRRAAKVLAQASITKTFQDLFLNLESEKQEVIRKNWPDLIFKIDSIEVHPYIKELYDLLKKNLEQNFAVLKDTAYLDEILDEFICFNLPQQTNTALNQHEGQRLDNSENDVEANSDEEVNSDNVLVRKRKREENQPSLKRSLKSLRVSQSGLFGVVQIRKSTGGVRPAAMLGDYNINSGIEEDTMENEWSKLFRGEY